MHLTEAFIDSNLLVLLVVGSVDRALIAKHRRTRRFTSEDYNRLLTLNRVFVTPNTLTEASNLLESQDTRFLDGLRILIEGSEEIVVASVTAVRHGAFSRLGLTDAALLEIISPERPLITVDLDLFNAALAKGEGVAFNFTHFQDFSFR